MSKARRNKAVKVPRIAMTGGIASGKSTVAKLFAALGAKLIDADQISRDVVTPPSAVLDRIAARFGASVLLADGSLDRAKLRQLVFADPSARTDLEALIHPAIHAEVARQARESGGPYQLVAIPLLVETNTQDQYDRVLVVDASPGTQRRRLQLRDGVDAAVAERMLAAQCSREQRRAIANDIIDNEGDAGHLAAQVEALHRQYLVLGSQAGDS